MSFDRDVQEYYRTNYSKCDFSSEPFPFIANSNNYALCIRIVNCICLPVYIFGCYCILEKTPKTMSSLKWPLFINHFCSSFHDILLCQLMTPVYLLPALAICPLGVFYWLKVPVEVQVYVFIGAGYTGMVAMTWLFENRSSSITYNKFRITRTSTKRVYYGVRLLIYQNYWVPFLFYFPDQNKSRMEILKVLPCPVEEFFTHPLITVGTDPSNTMFFELPSSTFTLLEYFQFFFFAGCCVYYLFLKKNGLVSAQTRQMQIRYFYGVMAQCIVPLTFLAIPTAFFEFSFMFGFHYRGITNLLLIIFSTHGFVQAIVIIAIHRPYREFIMSFFRIPLTLKKRVLPRRTETEETLF